MDTGGDLNNSPPAPAAGAGTFRSAWAHHRWRWLIASLTVSLTGTFLYTVALVAFVMDRTGSAVWVSVAVIARMAPFAVLSAPAGVLADRFDRRRLMALVEVSRAAILAAMAVVAWTDGPPLLAVALAAAASVVATPHRPAFVAAVPRLVEGRDLAAANAVENIVGQAAWFVGPAVAAAVLVGTNAGTAFLVAAVAFVAAAFSVRKIGDVGGGPTPLARPSGGDGADKEVAVDRGVHAQLGVPSTTMRSELLDGFRAVRDDSGLAALLLLVCALLFTFGMEQVLFVLVATDQLDLGPEGVGILVAAVGAGSLVVAPITARIGRTRRPAAVLVASSVLVGAPLVVLSYTDSVAIALVLLALEGAATIVNEIMLLTMLQRACPDHLLARVVGLQESSSAVTQVLGSAVAPVLLAVGGLRLGLWAGGAATIVAALVLAPRLRSLSDTVPAARG